ncbi:hypothetical protein AB0M47_32420 [Hamadaea sp. NPDC051192]|uniref:hypothetical protein n=1 Tax=Hamadaea sp. NPDC051192 TaxID=3154940 RepID=UPI00342F621F
MNWMAFVVGILQALAWPAVAALGILVFRRSIAGAFSQGLKRLKAGPIDLEFLDRLQEVQAGFQAQITGSPQVAVPSAVFEKLRDLARTDPVLAVVSGYQLVEIELYSLWGPNRDMKLTGWQLISELRDLGILTRPSANSVSRLRSRRTSMLSHPAAIAFEEAEEYVARVEEIIHRLRRRADRTRGDAPAQQMRRRQPEETR